MSNGKLVTLYPMLPMQVAEANEKKRMSNKYQGDAMKGQSPCPSRMDAAETSPTTSATPSGAALLTSKSNLVAAKKTSPTHSAL